MLRFHISDFDRPGAFQQIDNLFLKLGRGAESGVLLVDTHAAQQFSAQFANVLVERLGEFPFLLNWENAFYSSTSFPKKRKIPIGSVGRFERLDRQFYQQHILRNSDLVREFRFSDYGVDFPGKFAKGGGAPRAHLRFTSTACYVVSEGPSTKGVGFSSIKGVADVLASQKEFQTAMSSSGRDYVLALRKGDTNGTPTLWRWCATDHHFALVCRECFEDFGLEMTTVQTMPRATQPILL